MAVPFRR
nr:TPA_asm: m42 uORF 1 RNA *2 [Murid betaherpesvirus 1]DBA07977.1 TPA_asm: m42 uORF 1 RNA *2 [Murid betaherpesvirus 1]